MATPVAIKPVARLQQQDDNAFSRIEMGDSIFERAGMSLFNALQADPNAAVRSLLAPDTLPPQKRKTLVSDMTGDRPGLQSAVLNTLSNPIVIVGAALSYRWPILDPSKMKSVAKQLQQYERWIPGPLRKLLGLNEIFQGTDIPRHMSKIVRDSDEFISRHFEPVGQGIIEWRRRMGRVETAADQVRWALKADNTFGRDSGLKVWNKQIAAINRGRKGQPPLAKLTADDFDIPDVSADEVVLAPWRTAAKSIRDELGRDSKGLARMAKHMQQTKGMDIKVKWIEDGFFPRVGTKNTKALAQMRQKFIDRMLDDPNLSGQTLQESIKRFGKAQAGVRTGFVSPRSGVIPPDATDLSLLPRGSISERALHSLEAVREARMVAGEIPSYSLRFSPVVNAYANGIGRSYAWSWVNTGDKLIKSAGEVAKAEQRAGLGMSKTELLRNLFIPQAMGQQSFDMAMKATEWAGLRQAAWKMVNDSKLMQGVPQGAIRGMRRMLSEEAFWSPQAAGAKISNYFYLSTLGLNLASASQNLLQPLLTTAPVIGLGNTMRGMTSVISKIPRYAALRQAGKTEAQALREIFPEFSRTGAATGTLTDEIALQESVDIAAGGLFGARRASGKIRDVLMAPFRQSELFNRLTTFESARLQAASAGLDDVLQLEHATDVTNLTQLWAGSASSPTLLANWWGPFRQFLSFPAKLAGFALGSVSPTVTSAGMDFGIGGFLNPGTLGRAMMFSAGAYEAGKELAGADISRSLLFGGLPLPQEHGVGAPAPILPPLLSAAGSVALDVASGTTENTRRALPLAVPGGLQLARIAQATSPRVSKILNRNFADSSRKTQDGRIPFFTPDGQLIGFKTEFDLLMSNIGIPGKLLGPNGEAAVQDVERYILGNREEIRQRRRAFIDATLDNEIVEAEKLSRQALEDYGYPFEVTPRDWRAAQERRFIPRLERIVKTLPPEVRPRFLAVAQTALAGRGESFLGVDPDLLGLPRRQLLPTLVEQNAPAQDPFDLGL